MQVISTLAHPHTQLKHEPTDEWPRYLLKYMNINQVKKTDEGAERCARPTTFKAYRSSSSSPRRVCVSAAASERLKNQSGRCCSNETQDLSRARQMKSGSQQNPPADGGRNPNLLRDFKVEENIVERNAPFFSNYDQSAEGEEQHTTCRCDLSQTP